MFFGRRQRTTGADLTVQHERVGTRPRIEATDDHGIVAIARQHTGRRGQHRAIGGGVTNLRASRAKELDDRMRRCAARRSETHGHATVGRCGEGITTNTGTIRQCAALFASDIQRGCRNRLTHPLNHEPIGAKCRLREGTDQHSIHARTRHQTRAETLGVTIREGLTDQGAIIGKDANWGRTLLLSAPIRRYHASPVAAVKV